jgi:uncharacterized protein YrrD
MRDLASIVGLKVISSSEGRDVGTVSQVIVDLATGQIQGLIVGQGASERGIPAADLQVVGTDAIMVNTHKVARHLSELPDLLERRREPNAPAREVVTDTGRRLGTLGTIYVDPTTRRVTRYEVSGGAWRDMTEGVLSLAPVEGTVDGRDSVVVPMAAFAEIGASSGGLRAQLAKLGELARTQARQAAESLDESTQSVKRGAASVAEKATEAAAKLREEAGDAAARAAGKAHDAAASVAEKATDAASKLREQAGKTLKHEHAPAAEGAAPAEGEAPAAEALAEAPCGCCGEAAPAEPEAERPEAVEVGAPCTCTGEADPACTCPEGAPEPDPFAAPGPDSDSDAPAAP